MTVRRSVWTAYDNALQIIIIIIIIIAIEFSLGGSSPYTSNK